MANQEAIDYINKEKAQGLSNEAIRAALLQAGWDAKVVDEAFASLNNTTSLGANASYTALMGPVELCKKSFEIFKDKAQPLLITIAPLSALGLVMAFIAPSSAPSYLEAGTNLSAGAASLLAIPLQIIEAILGVIVSVVLITIVSNRTQKIEPMDAFKQNQSRILSFLWVSILVSAASAGGALFLVIPGIVVYLMVSLAPYIAVNEKIGGIEALVRSRAYTRNYLPAILGRLLFLILPMIPAIFVLAIFGKFAAVLSPVITIFATIYMVLIYENIKALNPNVDSKNGGKTKTAFIVLACLGPLIGIIGVIASLSLLALNPAELLRKSRDTVRMQHVNMLNNGVQKYYAEKGTYPQSLSELGTEYAEAGNDPQTSQPYTYTILPNGEGYQICANLESKSNDTRTVNGEYCIPMTSGTPPVGIE